MTAYDFDGMSEYRDVAARKTTAAPAGEPSVKAWAEALVPEASGLIARKHDALFRAVEALTKDPNLSQKARTRIRAVLVNHIEEWTQS